MRACVILMGGRGRRYGGDKVLERVNGVGVHCYSVRAFRESGVGFRYVMVYRDEEQWAEGERMLGEVFKEGELGRVDWVMGGGERQESVYEGLRFLKGEGGVEEVFIHDGARPCIRGEVIKEMVEHLKERGGVVLGRRVEESIVEVGEGGVVEARDRTRYWITETPQGFWFKRIWEAHEKVRREGVKVTDDLGAYSLVYKDVLLVENRYRNPKVTKGGDMELVKFYLTLNERG